MGFMVEGKRKVEMPVAQPHVLATIMYQLLITHAINIFKADFVLVTPFHSCISTKPDKLESYFCLLSI